MKQLSTSAILARLERYSDFAAQWFEREPNWRGVLASAVSMPWSSPLPDLSRCRDEETLLRELRRTRNQRMLHAMARDIGGASFHEVVGGYSQLAAWSLATTQHWHELRLQRRYGIPKSEVSSTSQRLISVAMGKFGGEELNASSDIDLVYLFPEEGATDQGLSNGEFFSKLSAAITHTLSAVDHDGFVFRVDTRLRPYGDEGPLAVSIDFLEQYFVEQARFWERLAWLRSASVTGDTAARQQLSALVRPFVYRRYLDYDAYDGLRDLHGKIRAEGDRFGGESNIKLGRGGIRELEFFVQMQQLVRGGRDRALQVRTTLPAVDALEHAGVFPPTQAEGLRNAYPFLRRVEHFLQYRNDAQTQILPDGAPAQEALAQAMGYADAHALLSALARTRDWVAAQFDTLADRRAAAPQSRDDPFKNWPEAEDARRYFRELSGSQRFAALPAQSAARVQALLCLLPDVCAATDAPIDALRRWGDLVEAVCRRSSYLALLAEHPSALVPITRVLAASAWAAAFLRDHPILLDELLDARQRGERFDANAFSLALRRAVLPLDDVEATLDGLRRMQQTAMFRILLADIEGHLSVEALADDLSALADSVIQIALEAAWQSIVGANGAPPLAVIAYGRWGGKELGYGSDLDWVFLAADDADAAQCARLVQRMQLWVNTLTAAGRLYETDIRLRPDGDAGLPFSTLSAFAEYQRSKAWFWEHQALSRARFAAGAPLVGEAFEKIRADILLSARTQAQVYGEIAQMRSRMLAQKGYKHEGFNVKDDAGGMVDIEFFVQALVLLHSRTHPFLIENKGNIGLLRFAGEAQLIPNDQAQALADAYRRYRAFQHQSRLRGETAAVDRERHFADQQSCVREIWGKTFG